MGQLVDGIWRDDNFEASPADGRFVRRAAQFRNWITADGGAGPSGDGGFRAEADRYHLYLSPACPWAHRTLIFRQLKGLAAMIGVSLVEPVVRDRGWQLADRSGPVADAGYASDIYLAADPSYTGRVTVPILWDKQKATIVSNESSEIIRMFNAAFDDVGARPGDYYPQSLRRDIDAINDLIYDQINNGVYKCGFAKSQEAYAEAFVALFDGLDAIDARLAERRYLMGARITEADWRLFTTLIRFDAVYVGHFKCNKQRIADYAHLSGYLRDLYQQHGIAETVHMDHIKSHYYGSHESLNPSRIIPLGPSLDLDRPHGRG
ncbi:MAG: glutathione S-transferase family protein [Rhodospirillales bacterium]|nr:glutathione S-transferase family protein [Rhodospirillales bacterium]